MQRNPTSAFGIGLGRVKPATVALLDTIPIQRINPVRFVGFRLGMDIHRGMISPLNRDLRIPQEMRRVCFQRTKALDEILI
jgi:hypothetical protein